MIKPLMQFSLNEFIAQALTVHVQLRLLPSSVLFLWQWTAVYRSNRKSDEPRDKLTDLHSLCLWNKSQNVSKN